MTKRLSSVANLIQKSNMVIDVGCDHAYLSIFLIQHKICNFVLNIDCNLLPLKNGEKNVIKLGYTNQIKFLQNNGLENLNINIDVDYITICGMGSQNIIEIISKSSINPKYYILQSNSNNAKLRKWLANNNYCINNEIVVYENNHYYVIILIEKKQTNIIDKNDIYIGPIIKNSNQIEIKNYLLNKYQYLSTLNLEVVNKDLNEEYRIIKNYCYEKKWIS